MSTLAQLLEGFELIEATPVFAAGGLLFTVEDYLDTENSVLWVVERGADGSLRLVRKEDWE